MVTDRLHSLERKTANLFIVLPFMTTGYGIIKNSIWVCRWTPP